MAAKITASQLAANLDSAKIGLSDIRDDAKGELLEILESLRGQKCLVLDPHIASLLNHVVIEGSKLLRVSCHKSCTTSSGRFPPSAIILVKGRTFFIHFFVSSTTFPLPTTGNGCESLSTTST